MCIEVPLMEVALSLELDTEVERLVRQRAEAAGLSVNELLARTFSPTPEQRVRALLAQWQAADRTAGPVIDATADELVERWRAEDAAMTEEEREAEDRLWVEVVRGLNETRKALGMRRLTE
jgi:hypothetical protein